MKSIIYGAAIGHFILLMTLSFNGKQIGNNAIGGMILVYAFLFATALDNKKSNQ